MFSTQSFKDKALYRKLTVMNQQGIHVIANGRSYLNLSSNDYLGISGRSDLQDTFLSSLAPGDYVMGALSSRLITGNAPAYEDLEQFLAGVYESRSCLLFNSGYHANTGILPALSGKRDLILADKLIHASLIDGLKLCPCKWLRYPHNDYDALERLLIRHREHYDRIFIVTESVFSMDGDRADLDRLIHLKKKYDVLLYVDEAHGVGVLGERGLGLCEESGRIREIDFILCTLGKGLASEGAFLICEDDVRDFLVNTSRSLIFTTALPPIQLKWTRFVFEKMLDMRCERAHLSALVRQFREKLQHLPLLGDTHIIPLLSGDNKECLSMMNSLREKGIWAPAIRYPTVPQGQARLRFSLSAGFTENQIHELSEAILAL